MQSLGALREARKAMVDLAKALENIDNFNTRRTGVLRFAHSLSPVASPREARGFETQRHLCPQIVSC
jgi:hypothetical protein